MKENKKYVPTSLEDINIVEEWKSAEEIADKIKAEFLKSNDKSEDALSKICEKNNMNINDYLYIEGYQDFEEFVAEI